MGRKKHPIHFQSTIGDFWVGSVAFKLSFSRYRQSYRLGVVASVYINKDSQVYIQEILKSVKVLLRHFIYIVILNDLTHEMEKK